MDTKKLIKRLTKILDYTDGTTMGAVIASDKIKRLIKELQTKQKLNLHGIMQAEGSDGVKGAAVGNSAAGKGVCVGTECEHPYYSVYGDLDTCLKCGKVLGGLALRCSLYSMALPIVHN